MSRSEEDLLLDKAHHKGPCKGVVLQIVLALGLTLLAVVGLSELALGVVMATNQTTCTTITPARNTTTVMVKHDPVLQGAMAIPVGLLNLILTTLAVALMCCHTGWARKFTEQCLCRCLLATIMFLLVYLAYSLSCLTVMLVQNCHEIIPALTLAVALFNLPLGTVAITMGPYLLYCLLVRRIHH